MTKTFAERCHIAQQFLPDAQYKAMLTALHTEMLAKLAEKPAPAAQQETEGLLQEIARLHDRIKDLESDVEFLSQPAQQPVAWRVKVETKLRDGSVDVGYQTRNEKLSEYDEPLYTTPQAQPAPEIAIADAYRAGVDSGIAAERDRCCFIVFGLCESDNVAQRTVDAIRLKVNT